MEESNVNNLNGVPNMGHGVSEENTAAVEPTEVLTDSQENDEKTESDAQTDVPADEEKAETNNG